MLAARLLKTQPWLLDGHTPETVDICTLEFWLQKTLINEWAERVVQSYAERNPEWAKTREARRKNQALYDNAVARLHASGQRVLGPEDIVETPPQ